MESSTTSPAAAADLRKAWRDIRTKGAVRARDAARSLGVSEAELVASECGEATTRLEGDFRELFQRLPRLGRVMALTRNESCVHERVGSYQDISFDGHTGLVLGPDIDLRVFIGAWRFAYAVEEPAADGVKRSLKFFDAHGTAVHKIHLRPESDAAAFAELAAGFRAARQTPGETVTAPGAPQPDRPDAAIDAAALRADWARMTDTHEFFPLLRRHGVGREQALRLADPEYARRLPANAPGLLLDDVARSGLPIMVFVGNPGMIQTHTGPVHNVRPLGPWLNVMDPTFNLHLRADHVSSVWLVRKPTNDGIVTSIELFDAAGSNIALFFGKRKPGLPESEGWREALRALEDACGKSA
jgi:putative hemin transport protein